MDRLGRAVEVNGEEGLHYAYRYDGEGNLIEAEDALGNRVSMEYDGNGNSDKGNPTSWGKAAAMRIRHWEMWKALPMRQGGPLVTGIKKGGLLEKIPIRRWDRGSLYL